MVAPTHTVPPQAGNQAATQSSAQRVTDPSDSDDIGATSYAWASTVRRARLTPTTKLVAFTVASHAEPDGTRVYPGVARLVYECGIGYSTVRRSLTELKAAGMLELVRRGNRRRRQSDEYRLVLGPDLLDRIEVPSPEEVHRQVEKINAAVTGSGRERQRRISAHVDSAKPASSLPAEVVDNPPNDDQQHDGLALTQKSGETRSNAHQTPSLALAPARPPSLKKTPTQNRHQPSSLAGTPQSPSTPQLQDQSRPHQGALMAVLCGICPDCDTALDPDGTCHTCRHCPPKPAAPISAHVECPECSTLLDPDGSCFRCTTWHTLDTQLAGINARAAGDHP